MSGYNPARIPSPLQLQAVHRPKRNPQKDTASDNELSELSASGSKTLPNPHFRRPCWTVLRTSCSFLCASALCQDSNGKSHKKGSATVAATATKVAVAVAVGMVVAVAVAVVAVVLAVAVWQRWLASSSALHLHSRMTRRIAKTHSSTFSNASCPEALWINL